MAQAHGWVKAFRGSHGVKAPRPVSVLAEPERALALCVEVSSHSDDVTGSPACVPISFTSMPQQLPLAVCTPALGVIANTVAIVSTDFEFEVWSGPTNLRITTIVVGNFIVNLKEERDGGGRERDRDSVSQ